MTPTPGRSYSFGTTVAAGYAEAVEQTRAALKEQGFGVLTEIDVQRTMKEKLGREFRPYIILGACNPPLAHRALQAELGAGLLLPCNVVVYDNGDNPAVAEVAREATRRLRRAVERLGGTA